MSKCTVSLLVLVLTFLIIIVAGCGKFEDSGVIKEGTVELTFVYWGGPEEKESIESLIKSFNNEHENIHVKPQQVNDGFLEKLTSQAASNTLPDLGYFPEGSIPAWL